MLKRLVTDSNILSPFTQLTTYKNNFEFHITILVYRGLTFELRLKKKKKKTLIATTRVRKRSFNYKKKNGKSKLIHGYLFLKILKRGRKKNKMRRIVSIYEALEITYSYWDGAGHRRVMQVRKGDTIGEFLQVWQ
uniref:FAM50A/XAP5 C-terminal domain-containing protein n=1 Tax=Lactuca sativa TaxID=4236 RepID=A0A9R1UJL4_LACSA|nr:hypothetical protein LSAT_V11C900481550 [Lactuca sativa]